MSLMFLTLSNITLTFTDIGDDNGDDDNDICCWLEDEMAWLSLSPDIICIAS